MSQVQALRFPPWFPVHLALSFPQTEVLNQFGLIDGMSGFKTVLSNPSNKLKL